MKEERKIITEDNVTKSDVILAASNILIRLGKNDWEGVRSALLNTSQIFEMWIANRPEKRSLETNHNQ